MNNFKKEKIVINQILNEQFAGTLAREVVKGLAKEAPAAAKEAVKVVAPEAIKTVGREVVAGTAADAVRSANSTTQTPPQITEIPPELVPILRPRSKPEDKPEYKPEDKPEPNSTNTPKVEDEKSVSSVSAIERFGIPILGELLRLKLGFNPLGALSPQSQSGTATKTATATATGKQQEKDLTGPRALDLSKLAGPNQYGYSSTNFASEVSPIFQRETGSQVQTPRGERRRAFKVPVEESQKPGGPGETKPQIREFDTINPQPQMPRGKDTLIGDPTPTEIAAKMRDVLIRQRSLRTKEKYSSRANENPPIKNIDHSAIHHPQIDGPINPGTA